MSVKTLVSPILFAGPLLSQTIKIIEYKESLPWDRVAAARHLTTACIVALSTKWAFDLTFEL